MEVTHVNQETKMEKHGGHCTLVRSNAAVAAARPPVTLPIGNQANTATNKATLITTSVLKTAANQLTTPLQYPPTTKETLSGKKLHPQFLFAKHAGWAISNQQATVPSSARGNIHRSLARPTPHNRQRRHPPPSIHEPMHSQTKLDVDRCNCVDIGRGRWCSVDRCRQCIVGRYSWQLIYGVFDIIVYVLSSLFSVFYRVSLVFLESFQVWI